MTRAPGSGTEVRRPQIRAVDPFGQAREAKLAACTKIRIDELGAPVLEVHEDAAAALAAMNRIGDETLDQLVTNGEGHDLFWLRLVVHDTSTGEDVAWAGIAR